MPIQRDNWAIQETKLIPPTKSGALVQRDRLLTRAVDGSRDRLVLFTAAAGYGKTSILVQLYEELRRQQHQICCWISLDEADNDHARFLSHLIEALRRTGIRFGSTIAILLGSGAMLPPDILRTSLLNELSGVDCDAYIFLDDYHLVTDPEVQETVSAILLSPLSRIHLLIASRTRAGLPITRLRALGQLTEMEGTDLSFSEPEAREFLGRSCRQSLDAQQVARLHEQTEGWATSLQLAAIALNGVDDVSQFLSGFSGETRTIGEFLGEEVLRRLPEPMQRFLMETSILRRFNVDLAKAVTGNEDARRLVDELEAKGLFIFSLDDKRNWYRYHHLFAHFLHRRLLDREPGRCALLHRQAAEWLSAHDFLIEAIDHAFMASDPEQAGRLLDEACVQLFASGQISTLQKHAARLPQEMLSHLPRLQLELSWEHVLAWRFSAAEQAMSSVRQILDRSAAGGEPTLSVEERAFLEGKLAHRKFMLALLTDRLDEAMTLARKWLVETPINDPLMHVSAETTLMQGMRERYVCEGTPVKAEALHRMLLQDAHAVYGTVYQDSVAGATLFMRGDLDDAQKTYAGARETALALQGEQAGLTAMPTALLAELYYERGELERARELLALHDSALWEFGFVDHPIARFVTLARLAFHDQRRREAEDLLQAGLQLADRHGMLRLHAHLTCERVRQLLTEGRRKDAECAVEDPRYRTWSGGKGVSEDATTTGELWTLAWARVCSERGEHARAVSVLKRWLGIARDGHCMRAVARISAVLARIYDRAGEAAAARRSLREALLIAGGFVRTYLDEGPPLAALLRDLHGSLSESDAELRQRIELILNACAGDTPDLATFSRGKPMPNAVANDELSPREREIVTLTAQGMATSDISRALGLTESTVKWYWQRIFSKLQVHRRFDAVKLARRQGWIA